MRAGTIQRYDEVKAQDTYVVVRDEMGEWVPKSIVIPLFSNLRSSVFSCFGSYMFKAHKCN